MLLHELMARIQERIAYKTGVSTVDTSAAEALARGAGVAQDHAHTFIACCRRLGIPARYISGYLRNDDPELRVGRTSHSWAEAWVPGLEWVGFDPANGTSPRGDHLRVAVGLDYRDAAPVSGRRVGFGEAKMTVDAESVAPSGREQSNPHPMRQARSAVSKDEVKYGAAEPSSNIARCETRTRLAKSHATSSFARRCFKRLKGSTALWLSLPTV